MLASTKYLQKYGRKGSLIAYIFTVYKQNREMDNLIAYHLSKETVSAIIILYKNTKVMVCSSDGDADFFKIVFGVFQRDTLAPYLSSV